MSFLRLLRAEWTKLRTVRGWVLALFAGALVIIALGVAPGRQGSCGQHGPGSDCTPIHGPEGGEVIDSFTLVHRTLTGDGTLTARVAALTGTLPTDTPADRPGLAPWAKAGLIIKDGTRQGSAYAAVMLTGEHGVRLQYDYVHDEGSDAGRKLAPQPVWLRLTRAGDLITAERSPDGAAWSTVGTTRLRGLPATVTVGLFVTSPQYSEQISQAVVLSGLMGGPSTATGTFDHLGTGGSWSGQWQGTTIGAATGPAVDARNNPDSGGGAGTTAQASGPLHDFHPTADGFALTGSGDIAPAVAAGGGATASTTLIGTFIGLIFVVVLGATFVSAEFRRGLIRTTFAATPHRGRVLLAKALVAGAAAFAAGVVAAAIVVRFGVDVLRDNGVYVSPISTATGLRLVAGTGVLLAGCAALAVGLGALLRRGVTAVTVSMVVIVLPYLLSVTVLPERAATPLLSVSPAAAFALQQSEPRYPQIDTVYLPADGYFPLGAWSSLAVLAAWVVAALAGAVVVLRRRDA